MFLSLCVSGGGGYVCVRAADVSPKSDLLIVHVGHRLFSACFLSLVFDVHRSRPRSTEQTDNEIQF